MEPKINGYVAAQVGGITNTSDENISLTALGVGVKYESKNVFAQAEVGGGFSNYLKAEVGKNIQIDYDTTLRMGVGMQRVVSNKTTNYSDVASVSENIGPIWKPNDTRGYASCTINFIDPNYEIGFGARTGIKTSKRPSLEGVSPDKELSQLKDFAINGRSTQFYIQPIIAAKANFGDIQLNVDLSIEQSSIGVAWKF